MMRLKVLIVLLFILFFNSVYAQKNSKTLIKPYVFTGISITNSKSVKATNFNEGSFPYVGVGLVVDHLQFSGILGNATMVGSSESWYEGNVSYYLPLGQVDLFVMVGVGSYFNGGMFIDYGTGLYKSINSNIGISLSVSNWNDNYYINPSLIISLYDTSKRKYRSPIRLYYN